MLLSTVHLLIIKCNTHVYTDLLLTMTVVILLYTTLQHLVAALSGESPYPSIHCPAFWSVQETRRIRVIQNQ